MPLTISQISKFVRLKNKFYQEQETGIGPDSSPIAPIAPPQKKILVNSDVILIPARENDKNLMKIAGLTIADDDNEVYIIKNREGQIKGALSISHLSNNTKTINYIDVDKDDDNFKKAIIKLTTSPQGYYLQKTKVEITKNNIDNNFIEN